MRRSSRRLSGTPRQRVGSLPIYVIDVAFKLQLPDARPVGPLNSRGAEHAPAGTRMKRRDRMAAPSLRSARAFVRAVAYHQRIVARFDAWKTCHVLRLSAALPSLRSRILPWHSIRAVCRCERIIAQAPAWLPAHVPGHPFPNHAAQARSHTYRWLIDCCMDRCKATPASAPLTLMR